MVREGTEGPYVGNGGSIRRGTPHEVANETSVNTAFGIERVVRYAFDLAERRAPQLTLVHKTNVLVHAGGMWQRIVNEVATAHPAVVVDYLHVDAATIYLVTNPGRFDVIVTDNLFGDILTDLAGAVTGGIGLAASGNINPDGAFPSMFEPVHGSAPDIAGQQKADPTAAILSIALLLDHLGLRDESTAVTRAVEADIAQPGHGIPSHGADRRRHRRPAPGVTWTKRRMVVPCNASTSTYCCRRRWPARRPRRAWVCSGSRSRKIPDSVMMTSTRGRPSLGEQAPVRPATSVASRQRQNREPRTQHLRWSWWFSGSRF